MVTIKYATALFSVLGMQACAGIEPDLTAQEHGRAAPVSVPPKAAAIAARVAAIQRAHSTLPFTTPDAATNRRERTARSRAQRELVVAGDELGLAASGTCHAWYVRDADDDGHPEATGLLSYGERNKRLLTYRADDDNADGSFDRASTIDYDRQGRAVRFSTDSDGDGQWNNVLRHEYSRAGDLVRVVMDSDGDGDIDQSTTNVYDHNHTLQYFLSDSDGDGVNDQKLFWVFDDAGRYLRTDIDLGLDGTVDYTSDRNVYDANGNLALNESDFDGDGVVDYRATHAATVAADGTIVDIADFDSGADGVIDAHWRYTYPQGNRHDEIIEADNDFNGSFDDYWELVSDEHDRMVHLAYDAEKDGVLEFEQTTTWLGDESEKRLSDVVFDAGTTTTTHTRYDDLARPLRSRTTVVDAAGTLTRHGSERWTYRGPCR